MPSVVTANRLLDGIVVYLAPDGGWVEDLGHARLANTEDEIEALESEAAKAVAERKVVAVYPMDVAIRTACQWPFPCAKRSAPPTAPR